VHCHLSPAACDILVNIIATSIDGVAIACSLWFLASCFHGIQG
jgi:hypothetical protein